jgi:putative ATPase
LFIVRRMVILAAEDVGLADPQALSVAVACQQAVHFIGMPEGFLPMAECALYLALAPKSNSVGASYGRTKEDALATSHLPVPLHLRNAVTSMMTVRLRRLPLCHSEAEHYAAHKCLVFA